MKAKARGRVSVLTNEKWQAILEAAAPLPKDAKLKSARRALAACLRDYERLHMSRDELREWQANWRHIDRLFTEFHNALLAELRDKRVIRIAEWDHKRKRTRIAEWSEKRVANSLRHWRENIKAVVEHHDTHMRARKGKLDPERGWTPRCRLFAARRSQILMVRNTGASRRAWARTCSQCRSKHFALCTPSAKTSSTKCSARDGDRPP